MAQLVTAEAKGEPYAGQVAVATVILNRVDSPLFPNTINSVIYQNGQFTPVRTGSINQTPTAAAIRAVDEAIAFRGQGRGSLFFFNPAIATNHWNATRQHTITIGNHVFAK
jgi:N-acetylmuramoyl-L-alanine amidase